MKKVFLCFLCFAFLLWMIACCPKNPRLDSVKTAHGNTDWHIDTAEEFLAGQDMNGTNTAANHCPDTWVKTHMHVGLTNTNIYYYDRSVNAGGKDDDSTNGIDKPMLFFYAGHGEPTEFSTLGNDASLTNMRIGNCVGLNDGTLRYYWQCSCKVFAHGPKNCTGVARHYACPENFDGSSDSDNMRNVYERWGPILHPNLRMACGSSTLAYCHETETNKIWDNYNNKGYDVADSFIDGLHRYEWNTPLCITTGGLFVSGTPLFDQTFTNKPNPSGKYFHIQYLSNFATTAPPLVVLEIPEYLPIYEMIPPPIPDAYRKMKFKKEDNWMYSMEKVKGRNSKVKINLLSGAVYVSGERRFDEKLKLPDEEKYMQYAKYFINEQDWMEKEISKPIGSRMVIDRVPKEGKLSDLVRFQKNALVTFKRVITIEDKMVNFVGEGGVISIQLNNDGSVFNATKVWRKIKSIKRTTKAKTQQQALKEAIAMIKEKEAYRIEDWTWGYKEAPGNVKQTELKAVYIFNFMPVDLEKSRDFPPRIIEISAHLE
ncbi:MAG: hypothetical protein KAU46_00380 [Candidatus Aminicenantes bacterium]|nr:hypothetical protein [Candidatus Aminicenantes bacterium]